MLQDATMLLHGSGGQLLLSDYLYRVLIILVAFIAVAIVVRWAAMIGRLTTSLISRATESLAEGNPEERER